MKSGKKGWKEGREEGREEGRKEGKRKGGKDTPEVQIRKEVYLSTRAQRRLGLKNH